MAKNNGTQVPVASEKSAKKSSKKTVKFVGPNGELQIVKRTIAPGEIQTYVSHITRGPELTSKGKPKKVTKKGVSAMHKDEASAQAAIDAISAQATKVGWVPKTKGAAKSVKADAFDLASLPTAATVNKK